MSDVILSKNSDMEKLMRFAIDKLEREPSIGVRASIEQAQRLKEFIDTLCSVFDCSISNKESGHVKVCGQHIKIVRYVIDSRKMEFHDEFKRI